MKTAILRLLFAIACFAAAIFVGTLHAHTPLIRNLRPRTGRRGRIQLRNLRSEPAMPAERIRSRLAKNTHTPMAEVTRVITSAPKTGSCIRRSGLWI